MHLEYIVSFSSELLQERGREELEESMQEENGKLFFCPGLTKTILNQIFRDGSNGDSGSRKDYELFNFNFFWSFVYYLKVFLNLMYVILIHLELSLDDFVSRLHHNYFQSNLFKQERKFHIDSGLRTLERMCLLKNVSPKERTS